jgi:hypothetical protein
LPQCKAHQRSVLSHASISPREWVRKEAGVSIGRGYAELLRTLGTVLDREGAASIAVVDLDLAWSVSWRRASGKMGLGQWHQLQLHGLRVEAIATRRGPAAIPELGHGEMLRFIGAACDRGQVDLAAVIGEQGRYRIAGVRNGSVAVWSYAAEELRRLVEQQRAHRDNVPGSVSTPRH